MDDMKRAIYLEVLSTLENSHNDVFICNELIFTLLDFYELTSYEGIVKDFFPEFYNLFDGYCYGLNDRWKVKKKDSWFSARNRQARITLINFLLSNR